MTGRVFLIGAGPGDPGLLTLKAKDCLEQSDVVVYDRLVSPEILAFIPKHADRVYVGKEAHNHTLPQAEIEDLLVEKALCGQTVSRLKGGDPFVYGRGAEEAEALAARGIPFEIVPGISSAIAAPAYAGIPLTHRTLASGFHVVTGHECLHSRGTPWEVLALSSQTLVILMGMGHLPEITDKLISYGRAPDTPVAVVSWGTTARQEVVVGTLATIAAAVAKNEVKPPAVIVVGDVVQLHEKLHWFEPDMALSL
ncbi:uroporphyrinogen-III C-methyltransferase [Alicyclobacillus pomorum]|jgi:uroporphyrin-III C-methyltransferase|uniref:uroporphyrinogen-III C-methyltransferase n=1 Tax=Alicyclobacillus pomorum TaxID=204470 RepID=UPI00040B3312|nr:uroporphyrinogen-III C-methyltransferase [Alicyclobacillus pomorum]